MTGSAATGFALALGAAAAYGFNIVFARIAGEVGVSGTSIVLYRVFVILAIIGLGAAVLGHSLRVGRGDRGTLALLGAASTMIGVCYLSSVAFIPVTVAVVIFYTFPILIVLASPFVEGRRLDPALLTVAAVAFLGVACVVGPVFEGLDPRGVALALLASVATATQFFAAGRCRDTGTTAVVFWTNVVVLPATALIAVAIGALNPPADLLRAPLAVTLTIAGFVAGFLMQFAALARASAVVIGLAFCAEPVVAALSSAAILGERLSALQIAGGALVVAAIMANIVIGQRRAAAAA